MTATPSFFECDVAKRKNVDRLFFDVDDTLTNDGQLLPAATDALHRAKALGLSLVAVTGRSLSWAEMLLRLFPLDAAVGETGAACLYWTLDDEVTGNGGRRVAALHSEPDADRRETNRLKRQAAAKEVFAAVPRARFALDNMGRVYDTAFDLVEDGPPLSAEEAKNIRDILGRHGLVVAQSSVHINAWFGAFDKATMVDRYLRDVCRTSLAEQAATLVYVGDSRNDGPMFAKSELSVGVANVAPHLDALAAANQAPKFVVSGRGGAGFAQVVDAIAAAKTSEAGA